MLVGWVSFALITLPGVVADSRRRLLTVASMTVNSVRPEQLHTGTGGAGRRTGSA